MRAHIGRWTTADVAVVGDARLVAEQLLAALPARPGSEKPFHTAENLATIAGFDIARDFEAAHTPRTVDPRALGVELDKLLPRERNVVYDAGNFLGILPYLTVPTPGHLKMTSEFASIGLGFGTALGVAKGRPHVPTVLVIGDGGFLMTMSELETVSPGGHPADHRADERLRVRGRAALPGPAQAPRRQVGVSGRGVRGGGGGVRVSGVHHPHAWTTCARSDRCWASRTAPFFWTARSTPTSPRPSWASSPNSKLDSTADQEGRAGDSVIVAAAIS